MFICTKTAIPRKPTEFVFVKVGDIVRVNNNEEIPCDLVVISTSEPDGLCHIMTANLDGETNLKVIVNLEMFSIVNLSLISIYIDALTNTR